MSVNVYNKNTGNLTNIAGGSSVNNLDNLVPSDTKETSIIATKPHTEGDYFEVNGSFVKAIDDITIGDTLTEGTNYETTNVGAELTDIESDLSTVSSNLSTVSSDLSTVSSNLGNKSSASAVSGSTAFAKINTLNNEVTDLNSALSGNLTLNTAKYPSVTWWEQPYLVKRGNVVTFAFSVGNITLNTDLSELVLFPEGFRPGHNMVFRGISVDFSRHAVTRVFTNGYAMVRSDGNYAMLSGTFIVET